MCVVYMSARAKYCAYVYVYLLCCRCVCGGVYYKISGASPPNPVMRIILYFEINKIKFNFIFNLSFEQFSHSF